MKFLEKSYHKNEAVSPSKFPAALSEQFPSMLPILISAAWLLFPVLPVDPKQRPPEKAEASPRMWLWTEEKNQNQGKRWKGKKSLFFSKVISSFPYSFTEANNSK